MSTDPRHGEASDRPDDADPAIPGEEPATPATDQAATAPIGDTAEPGNTAEPGSVAEPDAVEPDDTEPTEAPPAPEDDATGGADRTEDLAAEPAAGAIDPETSDVPRSGSIDDSGSIWEERTQAYDADAASTDAARPADGRTAGPATAAVDDEATHAYAVSPAAPGADEPVGQDPADEEPTIAVPAPTAEEDEAMRAERTRRFGRFGHSGEEARDPELGEVRTTALPASTEPASTIPAEEAPVVTEEPEPEINEEDPFEDWDDPPRSRAQAHWWVVLITLVFTPLAWYLIADGGERWSSAREAAPDAINVAGLIEIAGGLILLAGVLIAARWSSVGPIVVGSIAALIGGAFLAVPQIVEDFLAEYIDIFNQLGQFGQNVYAHLLVDGNSGRILAYGVVLIFAGVVSHGARRQGRREERRRAAVEAL